MEFRTDLPSSEQPEESDSGSTLEGLLETYVDGVKDDPEMKLQILGMAEENGIDPVLLKPLVDLDKSEIQKIQAAQQQQQAEQQQPQAGDTRHNDDPPKPMPEKVDTDSITPEDMSEFVSELMDYLDEDTTLSELKEYVDENPDLVQTAIKIHL